MVPYPASVKGMGRVRRHLSDILGKSPLVWGPTASLVGRASGTHFRATELETLPRRPLHNRIARLKGSRCQTRREHFSSFPSHCVSDSHNDLPPNFQAPHL